MVGLDIEQNLVQLLTFSLLAKRTVFSGFSDSEY